jgi:hypothetical protein
VPETPKLVTMPQTVGDCFPPDGEVGRFVVGLALYLQDVIAAATSEIAAREADPDSWKSIYFNRLAWAHWYESVMSLKRCESDEGIKAFLARLPRKAKAELVEAKRIFHRHEANLLDLRNQTSHYPSPAKRQRQGWDAIAAIMAGMLDQPTVMPQTKVKDAHYPWAAETAAGRVITAVGGEAKFEALTADMAKGVTDYNRFVMEAIQLAVDDGGRRYIARDREGKE